MALKLDRITLVSSSFVCRQSEPPPFQLTLTKYREKSCSSNKDSFCSSITLCFNLFSGIEKGVKCSSEWCLVYSGSKEDKAMLKQHIVVAHAIPYLREFSANIMMRAGFPQVLLDPTNAALLWKDFMGKK